MTLQESHIPYEVKSETSFEPRMSRRNGKFGMDAFAAVGVTFLVEQDVVSCSQMFGVTGTNPLRAGLMDTAGR